MGTLLGPDGQPIRTDETRILVERSLKTAIYANGQYKVPWPLSHMEPIGFLKEEPAYAAHWFFLHQAHFILREVPTQVVMDDEEDTRADLVKVARSAAICYGVEVSSIFEPEVIRRVEAEAARINRSIDKRIKLFIQSGGLSAAIYDRDPDA